MKECPACGASVQDDSNECSECGGGWREDGSFDPNAVFAGAGGPDLVVAAPPVVPMTAVAGSASSLGTAGFVCGLVGLVLAWPLSLLVTPVAIVGIVLSAIGRSRAKEAGTSSSLATAGLVCGIIGVVISMTWFVVVVTVLKSAVESS